MTHDAVAFARALESGQAAALLRFADEHAQSDLSKKAIVLARADGVDHGHSRDGTGQHNGNGKHHPNDHHKPGNHHYQG
jgi:hypothetical protein